MQPTQPLALGATMTNHNWNEILERHNYRFEWARAYLTATNTLAARAAVARPAACSERQPIYSKARPLNPSVDINNGLRRHGRARHR